MNYRNRKHYTLVGNPERISYGGISILPVGSGCLWSNVIDETGKLSDIYVGPYTIADAIGKDGKNYELIWVGYKRNLNVNPNIVFAR